MDTIRSYVDVRPHPTVVRLDDLDAAGGEWIAASYHLTTDAGTHLAALRAALSRPQGSGAFLIGPYGSGKSHFLAYLTDCLRRRAFVDGDPDVVALSLLNFRADAALEDIVCGAVGIEAAPGDRREPWRALMARHDRGLVLVIDELSEFLRSKPGREAFTEDVRYLQFLGEWAQGERFWVIAAMQEQIEHTGDLEHGLYRKIKDRFPLRLLLTPAHVRDLLAQTILVKSPGYDAAVADLGSRLRAALPDVEIDFDGLAQVYPLHPATLGFLEELRDRFSQARGAVDFAVAQLGGDPRRGIEPFLDRPFGELLTPDQVVVHFGDLFEVQAEFLPLSQQVLPWFRQRLPQIFDTEPLRVLAWRVLRLLVLCWLAPARQGLTLDEAVAWLLPAVFRLDPRRNRQIVERVLNTLASESGYIKVAGGRFRLDLADDGAALDRLIERETADLGGRGDVVFESLTGLFATEPFNPFALPRERWQPRQVQWHFHDRAWALWIGHEAPSEASEEVTLCVRLPWGDPVGARTAVLQPARLAAAPELLELAAMARLAERPSSPANAARLSKRLADRAALFRSQVRQAYAEAVLSLEASTERTPVRLEPRTTTASWLDEHARILLRRRFPSFESYAPTHGPLPTEAYRAFMRWATAPDQSDTEAQKFTQLVHEAYLVPMKLSKRVGHGYAATDKLATHPLVQLVASLAPTEPSPTALYEHLEGSVYGLVPDQIHTLLVFLLLHGEIDVVSGGRSYRELYPTLPLPRQYERVTPGGSLNTEELGHLQRLCEAFQIKLPREWTVLAQRKAIEALAERGREQSETLSRLLVRLRADDEARELVGALSTMRAQWAAMERGRGPLDGFRHLLFDIGSLSRFVARSAELGALPERIERQQRERDSLRYLLSHPAVRHFDGGAQARAADALGPPPPLDDAQALDRWIERARGIYEEHRAAYEQAHAAFWTAVGAHPIWRATAPAVARSRAVGLGDEVAALEGMRRQADALRCQGLVDLARQPVCHCGFDGAGAALSPLLERFAAQHDGLLSDLARFFAQDDVRTKLRDCARDDNSSAALRSYLDGSAPWPDVDDVARVDACLSALGAVTRVDVSQVTDLLRDRTWEPDELRRSLDELVRRQGPGRLRFGAAASATPGERLRALLRWCGRQALTHGTPLPVALTPSEAADLAEVLEPDWVGADGLAHLEALRIGDPAVDRALTFLLEGRLATPAPGPWAPPLVACALEVTAPSRPEGADALAQLSDRLYRGHARLEPLGGQRWRDRLDALAETPLKPEPPPLLEVLQRGAAAQWLLIDCLGAPLLGSILGSLDELFPAWHLVGKGWALVSPETSTHGCYRMLAEAGVVHPLEKVNCLDRLIHARFPPFDDLARLALAELRLVLGKLVRTLDPSRRLLVFSDHGFRITRDGRSYGHGGPSTLERLVPVLELASG